MSSGAALGDPEKERLRISEDLRIIQKDLAFYEAWMATESPAVANAYGKLVSELRRVAGGQMSAEWKRGPITTDSEMCVTDIDLSPIDEPVRVYLDTAVQELTFAQTVKSWVRRRPAPKTEAGGQVRR